MLFVKLCALLQKVEAIFKSLAAKRPRIKQILIFVTRMILKLIPSHGTITFRSCITISETPHY